MIQISPDSFSSPINSSYPVMGLVKPLKSSKDCEGWSWVFLPIAPRQSPLIKDQQGQKKSSGMSRQTKMIYTIISEWEKFRKEVWNAMKTKNVQTKKICHCSIKLAVWWKKLTNFPFVLTTFSSRQSGWNIFTCLLWYCCSVE